MNKIIFTVLLISCSCMAQLTYVKTIDVPKDNKFNANRINTLNNGGIYTARKTANTSLSEKIVYVKSGGLEPDGQEKYFFTLIPELISSYKHNSFSWSGPAKLLACKYDTGWGVIDYQDKWQPLILSQKYQITASNSIEVEKEIKVGKDKDHSVYIKSDVDLDNKIDYGQQNSVQILSFESSFQNTAPKVGVDGVFLCHRNDIELFDADLTREPRLLRPGLDLRTNTTAFATTEKYRFTVDAKSVLTCWEGRKPIWHTKAIGPVLPYKNKLFAFTPDMLNIVAFDQSSGKVLGKTKLIPFLPHKNNALMLSEFENEAAMLVLYLHDSGKFMVFKVD